MRASQDLSHSLHATQGRMTSVEASRGGLQLQHGLYALLNHGQRKETSLCVCGNYAGG